MVWLVLGGPLSVVIASVATAVVAWKHIDPVIATTPQGELRAVRRRRGEGQPEGRPGPRHAGAQPRGDAAALRCIITRAVLKQRALTILWPAFLMAGVLEMLVFVVVDPSDLRWFGGEALNWSRRRSTP